MRIGDLRHKVTIEQLVSSGQNVYGEREDVWETFLTSWASVEPLTGGERFAAQQIQSSVTHKIRMRYQPGITTEMRIKFGDRGFDIDSTLNLEERGRELLIMAKEAV